MESSDLFLTWIVLSLATYVGLNIYVVIRDRIDVDDRVTGIKIRRSRKKYVSAILFMLTFSFVMCGLAVIFALFMKHMPNLLT